MSERDEEDIFGYTTAGWSEEAEAERKWAELQRSAAAAKTEPYTVTRRAVKVQRYTGGEEEEEPEDIFGYQTIDYAESRQRAAAQDAAEAEEKWRQLVQSQKRQARKFSGRSPIAAPFFQRSSLPMTQVYTDTIQQLQAAQAAPGRSPAELANLRAQEQVYRRELANLRAQEAAHRERMAATSTAAMSGGKAARKARRSQRKSIRKLKKSMRKSRRALKRSLKRSRKHTK
jgi:hypothetical protein